MNQQYEIGVPIDSTALDISVHASYLFMIHVIQIF